MFTCSAKKKRLYNKQRMIGWCNSSEAVRHIYTKCVDLGVHFVMGEQKGCLDKLHCDPKNPSTVIGIKTKDGKIHYGDRVLLTTGSWTAGVVEMHNQVVASGQQVVHFQPPEPLRKSWEQIPVWCGDLSVTGYYGFPCNKDGRMKIGKHHSGLVYGIAR
jgi:sarcosine oxidase/L-pipecolate oxidase